MKHAPHLTGGRRCGWSPTASHKRDCARLRHRNPLVAESILHENHVVDSRQRVFVRHCIVVIQNHFKHPTPTSNRWSCMSFEHIAFVESLALAKPWWHHLLHSAKTVRIPAFQSGPQTGQVPLAGQWRALWSHGPVTSSTYMGYVGHFLRIPCWNEESHRSGCFIGSRSRSCQPIQSETGWWYTCSTEKYESNVEVSWDYYPQIYGKIIQSCSSHHQPNTHTQIYIYI